MGGRHGVGRILTCVRERHGFVGTVVMHRDRLLACLCVQEELEGARSQRAEVAENDVFCDAKTAVWH